MTATIRQRVDKVSLRWQARLDSEWSDRVLPWLVSLGLFIFFVALSLARARSLDGGVDLGIYTQGAWLIDSGHDATSTVNGQHVFAQQAAFIFYPIALLTRVVPIIPTLLVVQSAVLALGAVPLWRIARRLANLRVGAAATLLFVYAVYPAIHNLNLADFHPEVIAVPALLAACLYGFSERWLLFGLFCALAVLSRADLGLAVAGLGVVVAMRGHRKIGLATLMAGFGWTLLCVIVIQPSFGDGSYAHIETFAAYGDTPFGVLWGILAHPIRFLGDLFSEEDFNVLVFLLAPVFFLPVLAPRYLLPVVPLQVLFLVADVPTEAAFGQQTVAATAFVFVATAFALAKIGRQGVERITVDRRVLGALLLASTVFFIRDAASSPYRRPWDWGGRDAVDAARLDAVDLIDDRAAVRASPFLVPLLAEREEIYVLDTSERPQVLDAVARADILVFDQAEAMQWTDDELRVFREGIVRQEFTRVFAREGIEVYVREGRQELVSAG